MGLNWVIIHTLFQLGLNLVAVATQKMGRIISIITCSFLKRTIVIPCLACETGNPQRGPHVAERGQKHLHQRVVLRLAEAFRDDLQGDVGYGISLDVKDIIYHNITTSNNII